MPARRRRPEVHLVTRARRSRYDDIAARERRYLISMAIRTAAVVVAVFAPLPVWARAVAVLLGLVLPWVAVTSANTGSPAERGMPVFDANGPRELTAASPDPDPDADPDADVDVAVDHGHPPDARQAS